MTTDPHKALLNKLQQRNVLLPAGQVHQDDLTSQQLSHVGWSPGDPIPADLGRKLQALRDEAIKEIQEASYADPETQEMAKTVIKKLGTSSLVKITDLPPPQQRKVKSLLTDLKQQQIAQQRLEDVDSRVPAFIQGADREAMINEEMQSRIAIVDDRVAEAAATPPQTAAAPAAQSVSDNAGVTEPLPQICPCCDWNLADPYEVEITAEDKMVFLAALLGQRRFTRTMFAFGENVSIEFRTITVSEYNLILAELSAQVRNGRLVGNAEYLSAWMQLRLACCLSRLLLGGNVLYESTDLTAWLASEEAKGAEQPEWANSKLPVYATKPAAALAQETIMNAVLDQFKRFEQLTEKLRLKANDQNFW